MVTFNYNPDIPAGPNNPSNDQPLMQENTNSINGLIGVDHVSFNLANGGYHTDIHFVPQSGDPATIGGIGQLYTKTVTGDQQLFYKSGGGNIAQMTRLITASQSTFGTYTNYIAPATTLGGWTFLPGGMLLQYGTLRTTSDTTAVVFPVVFTTLYSVQLTLASNAKPLGVSAESTTGFNAVTNGIGAGIRFYWIAVGV